LLVHFIDTGRDIDRAVHHAIRFFHRHENNREVISLAQAAIHWFLASQSYQHAFEIFSWQYSVFRQGEA
jgi:hypothetical protein